MSEKVWKGDCFIVQNHILNQFNKLQTSDDLLCCQTDESGQLS